MNIGLIDDSCLGKSLRVEFSDGEVAEVQIIGVALPNKYDKTPESWGITYDLISSNKTRNTPKGAAYWSRLDEIKSFEIIGEKAG